MILTIDINKEAPSIYTARTMNGGMPVTDPETYDRVETAIREEALNVPPGFAHFIEFTYGGISTGTYAIAEVPEKAGALADRLIALIAEQHRIMESLGQA